MVLPISLLRTAQNHPMLVELKNGETYNGHLVNCDTWMNLHLRDAICTSRDGDRFWKVPEVYIRGSTIKYMRIPDEVLDQVREDMRDLRKQSKENSKMRRNQDGGQQQQSHRGGGGGGGRGGGRGGGTGGGGGRGAKAPRGGR